MSDNFYKKTTVSIDYYKQSSFGTEPDLRVEMERTIDGFYPEISKGQTGLLRRMRKDSLNKLIPCGCVDKITKEPDKDRFCGICFGEGFIWDELYIEFYKILQDSSTDNATRNLLKEPGLINASLVVFYLKQDVEIFRHDKIVTLILDDSGSIASPIKRKQIYKVNTLWDYRSDNGKLEYYKLYTHEENVKYLNAPSYEEV